MYIYIHVHSLKLSWENIKHGPFTFHVNIVFPLSLPILLPNLTVYLSSTASVLVGSVLLKCFLFCIALLCVSTYLVPFCDGRYDFCIKRMFGSFLPNLFVLLMLFDFVTKGNMAYSQASLLMFSKLAI